MDRIRAISLHTILVGALFVLVACDDSNADSPTDGDGAATSPTPTADASTSTPPPTGTSPSAGTPTATGTASAGSGGDSGTGAGQGDGIFEVAWDESVLTLRDGTWPVGDAGEVEFAVRGDRLELLEVRAAEGWSVREQEVESDEIEVDFERGNVDWKFEVEIDDGILEIEIDQDIENAEAGTYTVGLAGTVEFEFSGGSLTLVEVLPNEGWSHSIDEQDSDDIEIDFRRDNVTWEFNVDLDDGRLEVEIDFEIEGRFPA